MADKTTEAPATVLVSEVVEVGTKLVKYDGQTYLLSAIAVSASDIRPSDSRKSAVVHYSKVPAMGMRIPGPATNRMLIPSIATTITLSRKSMPQRDWEAICKGVGDDADAGIDDAPVSDDMVL